MKLEELGKIIQTDVLVIGAGIAGLATSIFVKEKHPELDVLVVEENTAGLAGQGTKAGHGFFCMMPDMDVEKYVEWATRIGGQYLNDQDLLRQYGKESYESAMILKSWGATMPTDKYGNLKAYSVTSDTSGMTGLDNDIGWHVRNKALEMGVRIMNHTQTFDYFKDKGRVVGAVGMNLDNGEFYIFRAKAVAQATSACHYKVSGMFKGYGDAIAAAFEAGAEMRNAEFFTQCDIITRKTGDKIYGCHQVLFNSKGENLSDKYDPGADEVTYPLIFGMKKEIEEGNGPLYIDLTIKNDILDSVGMMEQDLGDGAVRFGPNKLKWLAQLERRKLEEGHEPDLKPEVSITFTMTTSPVRVDHEMKTTVDGLWAVGAGSYWGQSYMGWIHGDGTGNAIKSAMHAGPSVAEYAASVDFGNIDVEQAAKYKEHIYEPLGRKEGYHPQCFFDEIGNLVTSFEYCIMKSEDTMNEALNKIEEIRSELPNIRATDWHELAKCKEVEGMLTCAQIAYTASLNRRESRGFVWRHNRVDFPETDNKNWLKWVILKRGKGNTIDVRLEPVPIENYKYKPTDVK